MSSVPTAVERRLGPMGLPLALATLLAGFGAGLWVGRRPEAPVAAPAAAVDATVDAGLPTAIAVREPPDEPSTTPPDASLPAPEARKVLPTPALEGADERTLMESARAALAKREPERAQAVLEAHARRFPAGLLAEERERLWVLALVAQGHMGEARRRADDFQRRFPESTSRPLVPGP